MTRNTIHPARRATHGITPRDYDRIQAAVVPADAAARSANARWGVGRLENLVSSKTLLAFHEGWKLYATAIAHGDADAVERLAPKIVQAIHAMEREAEAAGHAPLAPDAWEAPLADGRVLVVTRTQAEAQGLQGRSDGRERVVWTMDELAHVLPTLEVTYQAKVAFPGARVQSRVRRDEAFAGDWVRGDCVELHER